LDCALEAGLIAKSGSWFSYNDEKIGQGREKTIEYLKANPNILNELENK
jgi:recombination protein RecA